MADHFGFARIPTARDKGLVARHEPEFAVLDEEERRLKVVEEFAHAAGTEIGQPMVAALEGIHVARIHEIIRIHT